ncbi:hypothetical protein K438DRAFT_1838045 [Mycena galopus ATCC 62051]|nr:hypothetical protein K438DRAFT_1860386 [Mycena galopus ATCC 62051]KAF8184019.1 hypothetical protein K438DRAFT_1838045 [Mycena galopus ATCC 62051]
MVLAPSLRSDRLLGVEQPGRDVVCVQPSISLIHSLPPPKKTDPVRLKCSFRAQHPRLRRRAPQSRTRPPVSPLSGYCRGPNQHMLGLLRKRRCHHPGIRAFPSSPEQRFCATPTPYESAPRYGAKHQPGHEYSSAPATPVPRPRHPHQCIRYLRHPHTALAHLVVETSKPSPRGKRRSPIKGLFSVASPFSSATVAWVLCAPLPPLVCGAERQCGWRRAHCHR